MKKILLVFLIGFLVVAIGIILILGYMGIISSVSDLFGFNKPRDLGVTWTKDDYNRAHQKTDVKLIIESGEVIPEESIIFEGSRRVDLNLTDTEITAIINNNQNNWKYFPVSDVQIKIGDDGLTQVSGIIHVDRLEGYFAATGANYENIKKAKDTLKFIPDEIPFYTIGTASVTDNVGDLSFTKVELGKVSVPSNYLTEYKGLINDFFNQQLNAFPGFFVKSWDLSDGNVNFKGTLPESIKTYK